MSEIILTKKEVLLVDKTNSIPTVVAATIEAINTKYHANFEEIMQDKLVTTEARMKALKDLKNKLVKERTQSKISAQMKEVKSAFATGTKGINECIKQYDACVKEMEAIILAPVLEYEKAQEEENIKVQDVVETLTSYHKSLNENTYTRDDLDMMEGYLIGIEKKILENVLVSKLYSAVTVMLTGALAVANFCDEPNSPVAQALNPFNVDDLNGVAPEPMNSNKDYLESLIANKDPAVQVKLREFLTMSESKIVHNNYLLINDVIDVLATILR